MEEFGQREVVIKRTFDAPRELVFTAWTDSRHMAQWWGPRGFTNPVCEIEPRVGGAIRVVMRSPDGTDHAMKGVFREFVRPERLAFTNEAVDAEGNLLLEGYTIVSFVADGDKTKVTLQTRATGRVPLAPQMLSGMEEGWSQSFDKLAELLSQPR
jgi:uncharacterized protein YndB with AHSA1/START domain